MDMKKENKNNNDDTLNTLQEAFNPEVPVELENELRTMLSVFRQDLKEHPYFENRKWKWRFKWRWIPPLYLPMVRFLLLTCTVAACLVIVIPLFLGNKSITWADLEDQFRAMPSCTVSVYIKDAFMPEPVHAQYWIGKGGKIRIHSGSKITFSKRDEYIRTFNIKTRAESIPCWFDYKLLRALDRSEDRGRTTLKSIIEAMTVENVIDTTSIVISDAEVARDLLVFDAESYDTLWFIRVWALRESKLPIRIVKWHRHYDRYEEILFQYSKEQPEKFFDPAAFAEKLEDQSYTEYDLKFLFLQDPGGSSFITPGS